MGKAPLVNLEQHPIIGQRNENIIYVVVCYVIELNLYTLNS